MRKLLFIFFCFCCFSLAYADSKTNSGQALWKVATGIGTERFLPIAATKAGTCIGVDIATQNLVKFVGRTAVNTPLPAPLNTPRVPFHYNLGTANVPIKFYNIPYAPLPMTVENISSLFHSKYISGLKKIPSLIVPKTQAVPETTPVNPPTFRMHLFGGQKWASGFAMEVEVKINGKTEKKIVGFSAGHVGQNISMDPMVTVEKPNGEMITAPIEKYYNSHKKGTDLMAFEIPQEIIPHIQILRPSAKTWEVGEALEISGYSRGIMTQLHEQKILLASDQRYVLQHTNSKERTGMCGSPVQDPATGEVVGIYVGFNFLEELRYHNWFNLLPQEVQKHFTDVHYVVPIQNVYSVIEAMEAGSDRAGAVPMKVMGFTVAPLYPNEFILSLTLLRDGMAKQSVYPGVLTDLENLEKYFELKENDVVRIAVNRPQTSQNRVGETMYDINVSTGEVTKRDIRPGVF